MKFLKYIALSLFLTLSSTAFADVYSDIDDVSAKITEAEMALKNGASSDDVIILIREANKLTKIFKLPDTLAIKRQRANKHLKKARLAINKGDTAAGEAHLEKAAEDFKKLKGTTNCTVRACSS